MLEVKDLSYAYEPRRAILSHLSFSITSGERVTLLGPSGYGKSTLALLLAGFLPLQKGEVFFHGVPLPNVLQKGYREIQLIYQHPEQALNPRWKLKKSLFEAWDVPRKLADDIGILPDWLDRYPHELSGGQLQRISILRALHPKTRLLIADEITTSLDPITQAQIWKIVLEETEKHGTALIAITHNASLAERISTRNIHIEEINGIDRPQT